MIQATRAEREVMQVGTSSDGYNSAPEASLFDAGAGGGDEWVVVQGLPGNDEAGEPNGTAYHTRIVDEDGGLVVEVRAMAADAGAVAARVRVGDYSWQLEQPLLEVEMDGVARVVQYHTPSGTGGGTRACGFNLGLCGAVLPMNVLTPKEVSWWLVVGGWWLMVVGWRLLVGGWCVYAVWWVAFGPYHLNRLTSLPPRHLI